MITMSLWCNWIKASRCPGRPGKTTRTRACAAVPTWLHHVTPCCSTDRSACRARCQPAAPWRVLIWPVSSTVCDLWHFPFQLFSWNAQNFTVNQSRKIESPNIWVFTVLTVRGDISSLRRLIGLFCCDEAITWVNSCVSRGKTARSPWDCCLFHPRKKQSNAQRNNPSDTESSEFVFFLTLLSTVVCCLYNAKGQRIELSLYFLPAEAELCGKWHEKSVEAQQCDGGGVHHRQVSLLQGILGDSRRLQL